MKKGSLNFLVSSLVLEIRVLDVLGSLIFLTMSSIEETPAFNASIIPTLSSSWTHCIISFRSMLLLVENMLTKVETKKKGSFDLIVFQLSLTMFCKFVEAEAITKGNDLMN